METVKIYTKLKREKRDNVEMFLIRLLHTPISPEHEFSRSVASFYDKDCTKVHCNPGKNRTLRDLYSLMLSKYPNLSYNTFCKALFKVVKGMDWRFILCRDVNDWVIQKHTPPYKYRKWRIGTYASSPRKIYLSGTKGYDLKTVLGAVGISTEYLDPNQTDDIDE